MSKQIHVAWPILCKVELEDAMSKLNHILEMVNHRGNKDVLVLAMESVISAGKKASEELEEAYGK